MSPNAVALRTLSYLGPHTPVARIVADPAARLAEEGVLAVERGRLAPLFRMEPT
jgi:hypothetical protein